MYCLSEAPHGVSVNGSTKYILGTTLELNCTVKGGFNISFTWTKNGEYDTLPTSSIFSNSSTVIIHNVTINDTGNYTCTASNDAGSSSVNTYVIVYGECCTLFDIPMGEQTLVVELYI